MGLWPQTSIIRSPCPASHKQQFSVTTPLITLNTIFEDYEDYIFEDYEDYIFEDYEDYI